MLHRNYRHKLTWKEIAEILDRDGGPKGARCKYCGKHLNYSQIIFEHMTPLSRGGTDDIENITTACLKCNAQKGTKTADEFIEWMVCRDWPQIIASPQLQEFRKIVYANTN